MPPISFKEAHGGAGWGTPARRQPVGAEALATVATLAPLERWADAEGLGRVVDRELPGLVAWAIEHTPDIHAMPPISPAEQACRNAQARAVFALWRE